MEGRRESCSQPKLATRVRTGCAGWGSAVRIARPCDPRARGVGLVGIGVATAARPCGVVPCTIGEVGHAGVRAP